MQGKEGAKKTGKEDKMKDFLSGFWGLEVRQREREKKDGGKDEAFSLGLGWWDGRGEEG